MQCCKSTELYSEKLEIGRFDQTLTVAALIDRKCPVQFLTKISTSNLSLRSIEWFLWRRSETFGRQCIHGQRWFLRRFRAPTFFSSVSFRGVVVVSQSPATLTQWQPLVGWTNWRTLARLLLFQREWERGTWNWCTGWWYRKWKLEAWASRVGVGVCVGGFEKGRWNWLGW